MGDLQRAGLSVVSWWSGLFASPYPSMREQVWVTVGAAPTSTLTTMPWLQVGLTQEVRTVTCHTFQGHPYTLTHACGAGEATCPGNAAHRSDGLDIGVGGQVTGACDACGDACGLGGV